MKKITLIFTLICSMFVLSQSDSSNSRKINFGLFITPELNNLILKNPTFQEQSKSKLGASIGAQILFQLNKNVSFRTGIGFGKKNYNHIQNGIILGSDIDPKLGIISESTIDSKISFYEFQLPIAIQYSFLKNKLFFSGGFELIYPIINTSKRIVYSENGYSEILSNSTSKELNFAPMLSIGYKLPISNKINITFEPMFKLYLKDYIIFSTNLYNVGLKTTLNF